MRILQVSSLWPPAVLGGAELYAARLAAALREHGHEVGAFTFGVDGDDVVASVRAWPFRIDEYAERRGWRRAVMHARSVYDPVTASVLRRAIADWQPDVVHSHAVPGLSVAGLIPRGTARVHHLHDYWLLCARSTLNREDRDCEPRCRGCTAISGVRLAILRRRPPDVVVSVSAAVVEAHRRWVPWLTERSVVLHLPSDVTPEPPRRPPTGTPVVGFIGQWTQVKGVMVLLEAVRTLPRGMVRVRIAGRGPLREAVEAAAGGDVEIVGWVAGADREAFFDSIDALVVPSTWQEPGATVAVEARARGLPVIGSATGGIPEVVDPASRDLLVAPGDVQGLAAALRSFATEPARYRSTGAAPLTWEQHAGAVENLYGKAMAARST